MDRRREKGLEEREGIGGERRDWRRERGTGGERRDRRREKGLEERERIGGERRDWRREIGLEEREGIGGERRDRRREKGSEEREGIGGERRDRRREKGCRGGWTGGCVVNTQLLGGKGVETGTMGGSASITLYERHCSE